ncbi:FAD-binding protein [Escherichia coli]|uniref:FAD-binding protein n=1 Tax=Escherichia coli TaxID=562 RepID=UPI00383AC6D8
MSQLNSVWVFSDNPERYAELFGGAQQWGQQVYAIVQNTDQAQAVMPYGPKCIYVLEQNDALQRTENYAESIAALLKDKHPAMLLLAATKRGKALAARLSVQLNAAVLNAEVGCSRPIAEGENWMERERYIGVSGVLLKSDLYLTLGISGQIQHMVGGNGAKVIVAINKDKNAPIFNYADYGLVGDIYKVVPALISQLSR